jgi:hypothetical protein
MRSSALLSAAIAAGLSVLTGSVLAAQHPVEGVDWSVQMIRASGQPVAPVFEGWYENEDGTRSLVFGYHNLNTEEVIEIPLGPDNFIEPRQFDGMQPTRFDPIPKNGARRHWGVFTVKVPADFGDQRVVWTLRHQGSTFKIPAHTGSTAYLLDPIEAPARSTLAPFLRFAASGPGVRGRDGMVTGPLSAQVGMPLDLTVWVTASPRPQSLVWWFKHQGPGEVQFQSQETLVESAAETQVRTTATFSSPGEYLLRVKAVERIADIEFHCCWTNGYVRVNVSD